MSTMDTFFEGFIKEANKLLRAKKLLRHRYHNLPGEIKRLVLRAAKGKSGSLKASDILSSLKPPRK